jgi:hypothetical protein
MTNPAGAIIISRLPQGLGGNQVIPEMGKFGHTSSFPKFASTSSSTTMISEPYVKRNYTTEGNRCSQEHFITRAVGPREECE